MTIEIKAIGLADAIEKVQATPEQIDKTLHESIVWGANRVLKEVQRLLSGSTLKVRTARFRTSVKAKFRGKTTATVGTSTFRGARIREWGTAILPGGRLVPKMAKFIAVPLPAAMTAAGVARRPRSYPDTFVVTSKLGGLVIMGKRVTDQDQPQPLFALKKSVKQEGAFTFTIAQKTMEPVVLKHFGDQIAKLING